MIDKNCQSLSIKICMNDVPVGEDEDEGMVKFLKVKLKFLKVKLKFLEVKSLFL